MGLARMGNSDDIPANDSLSKTLFVLFLVANYEKISAGAFVVLMYPMDYFIYLDFRTSLLIKSIILDI